MNTMTPRTGRGVSRPRTMGLIRVIDENGGEPFGLGEARGAVHLTRRVVCRVAFAMHRRTPTAPRVPGVPDRLSRRPAEIAV